MDEPVKNLDEALSKYESLSKAWWEYQYKTKEKGSESQFPLDFSTFILLKTLEDIHYLIERAEDSKRRG